MDNLPFCHEIKNQEIALTLEERGFTILVPDEEVAEEIWLMQAPQHLSATKAKKIVSTIIRLYSTAKEMSRAQVRYDKLVNELECLERQ